MKTIFNILIIVAIGFGIYGTLKSQPEGISISGSLFSVPNGSVTFLEDVTYVDKNGVRHSEQEIFDEVFRMIARADEYILIDFFLFNEFLGDATTSYRSLSSELTKALVEKKKAIPTMDIVFITDPINDIYGGLPSKQIQSLRDAEIEVVVTELLPLRDSNPIYSAFYRPYLKWFEVTEKEGKFANPFDARAKNLTIPAYFSLLNFKANHRKVILADNGNKFSVLVTSANPHDGSSAHTNTAIKIDDAIWTDVLQSELAVVKFSNKTVSEPSKKFVNAINDREGDVKVQLLTEGKIRDKLVETIQSLNSKDTLDIAMFYLADRKIITELKRADDKGVVIRILLDPNKDAFGREKNGIPNRSAANELIKASSGNTNIRFCETHGEQCHTKMVLMKNENGVSTLIQGSANLTRRNIGNFNLETNVLVKGSNVQAILDAEKYFEKVWNNEDDKIYSTPYETYKDESKLKTLLYRIMEELGTSSF